MKIVENFSLQALNTLALKQFARFFCIIESRDDLAKALAFARSQSLPWMVLGSGSNLVLSRDYPGLVIHNGLKGIQQQDEEGTKVKVRIAAGEEWHFLVKQTLEKGWYGLENLALIPGTVGAAPVQNIGAYGVELCDVFHSLEAWDEKEQRFVTLDQQQCQFGYRDSLFKQNSQRFVILSVTLNLSKVPRVNIHYQSLQEYFSPQGSRPLNAKEITPEDVFRAVIEIRRSKLPDPVVIPNAGSFFKNPVIAMSDYEILLRRYPQLISYPVGTAQRKLAAGWLIEQAGWKGKRQGAVGVHPQQALVLVNYGDASGSEILHFANTLCEDIERHYGVILEIEPVVL